MAAKSGATTLECTYCNKQYTEGEGEKTVFGNYKCKVKRSGGQEQYHPGGWVSYPIIIIHQVAQIFYVLL